MRVRAREFVIVEVEDNGLGIDENQREVASILRENALRLQQLIENLGGGVTKISFDASISIRAP